MGLRRTPAPAFHACNARRAHHSRARHGTCGYTATRSIGFAPAEMPMKQLTLIRASCRLALLSLCSLANAAPFIAGTAPDRRPVDAPVVTQYGVDPAGVQLFLHGVVEPAPSNVADAVRSGPWFMPLRAPGMTPPYDIRGWFPAAPR